MYDFEKLPEEGQRLQFVFERDGRDACIEFAARMFKTYGAHLKKVSRIGRSPFVLARLDCRKFLREVKAT